MQEKVFPFSVLSLDKEKKIVWEKQQIQYFYLKKYPSVLLLERKTAKLWFFIFPCRNMKQAGHS